MFVKNGHNINALDAAEPYDVCIIGSGFAGTVLGTSLVKSGVRTLILESGESVTRWLVDTRLRNLAAYEVSGNTNYPTKRTKARATGGNSNFWTGRCERFHPSDFTKNAYTPPDNPWPIDYQEIEPYYEEAEATLRVRGGPVSKYMPPRKKRLPLATTTDISSLKALLAAVGVTVDDSPTATPRNGLRFFRVQKELLPQFVSSPYGTLVSGVTVTRLQVDDSKRVVGAEARTLDNTAKIARARIYVVACGGIETPRLLLLSRSSVFPNGIGNDHDWVGRGFNEHPGVNFYGNIRHSRNTVYPRHQVGRSHQFYTQLKSEGLGSPLFVMIQSWIFPNHLMPPSELVRDFVRVLGRIRKPTLYIGNIVEMLPQNDNRVILSKTRKDRFGNPIAHLIFNFSDEDVRTLERTRELIRKMFGDLGVEHLREADLTFSRHHIGTCRMGDNPKTSVTDRQLRVHDCPNLYLCGSETFVTGTGMPPVLTIVALAHRLAQEITERLKSPKGISSSSAAPVQAARVHAA